MYRAMILLSIVLLLLSCKKRSSYIKSATESKQLFNSLSARLKGTAPLSDTQKRQWEEDLHLSDLSTEDKNNLFFQAAENEGTQITDMEFILTNLMINGADTSMVLSNHWRKYSVACEVVSNTLAGVSSEKHDMDELIRSKANQGSNYLTQEQQGVINSKRYS